jgi:hypothetical protein
VGIFSPIFPLGEGDAVHEFTGTIDVCFHDVYKCPNRRIIMIVLIVQAERASSKVLPADSKMLVQPPMVDPCAGLRVIPPSLGQRPRPKHWKGRVSPSPQHARSVGQSHVLLLTPSRSRVATYTRSTTIASGCHHRQTFTTRTIQPRPIDDPELCCSTTHSCRDIPGDTFGARRSAS